MRSGQFQRLSYYSYGKFHVLVFVLYQWKESDLYTIFDEFISSLSFVHFHTEILICLQIYPSFKAIHII